MADSRAMTLDLFVAETGPADSEQWQRTVSAIRAELQPAAPGTALTAWRHDPTALGGLAHGEETAQAPTFVALVQVERIAADRLAEVLGVLAAQLASYELIDRARSAVVVGEELIVVPGVQPLMLAMALPRVDALDRVEFQRYWATTHAELGRRVPGSQGYRQCTRTPPRPMRRGAS
jgi:hypothetical protein